MIQRLIWTIVSDNKIPGAYNRGHGRTHLILIGTDSSSKELLNRLSKISCITSKSKQTVLANLLRQAVQLHIVPNYSEATHLAYVKEFAADALMVFASGPPNSIIFSLQANTPRLFEKHKFDESLQK